ncbi:MAG: Gfo/Idh/MocA family oxidoreductase [Saprospiraceae bacterium]|nr:Gfo/Idh/MocA family oxidoreductase [Saprospiraceae bacterium]
MVNRRSFLKNTGAFAGITILPFPIFGKQAPSNKVVLGVAGVYSRGSWLAEYFAQIPNVEVAYICDVEDKAIANGIKALHSTGKTPTVIKDIRKLVTLTDLDAIAIATPDHWHTPASILGITNGKHVYVEKPCGHNPAEGELLVQASKKYKPIVQMGNQRRSYPTLIEAVKRVKEGLIGNPYFVKTWYTNKRKPIGVGKTTPIPSTLDFDLWQGPAPRMPFKDNLVHYNWHWFWHWGTGEACNNGTHEVDCARWFLGVDYPVKVTSTGGRYAYKDDWQTPDTQTAGWEFNGGKNITWEGRSCNDYPIEGSGRGFIVHGDQGTLVNDGGGSYKVYDLNNKITDHVDSKVAVNAQNTVSPAAQLDKLHLENFIETIRGNVKLNSSIEEASKSVLLCHLANIAQRTGNTLHCDPTNGHILKDKAAMGLWKREYQKGWAPVA